MAFALLGAAACGSQPGDPGPDPGSPEDPAPELQQAIAASLDHLEANAAALGLRGRGEVKLVRAFQDELDLTHARFQQTIDGVPVFGGEGIVHVRRDRSISAVTDGFVPGIAVSTTPKLSAGEAIARALPPGLAATSLAKPPAADLWALRRDGRDRLVWRVRLRLDEGPDRVSLPVVFVDAHDGSVVWQYDNLQTGTGPSLYSGPLAFDTTPSAGAYYMEDLPRKLGAFELAYGYGERRFQDADDVWDGPTQRPAIDAHYGAAMAYEYFQNVHGRIGINGSGGPAAELAVDGVTPLITSYVVTGYGYNNAYWDGVAMTYGDGDGVMYSAFVALDVVGHEMMHGITQYTAGLVYAGESGALNESYSDIFGAMVRRYARGESDAIWKHGDEYYTPGVPGDASRYLDTPHQASNKGYTLDDDPDHYSERYLGEGDNGGVHINSGIGNKTFYLLANGGSHHLGGSMTGIGADRAAAIWYKALTAYMVSTTDFARAARATYRAAVALFGEGSAEAAAVVTAWGLTGVPVDTVGPQTAITSPTAGATVVAPMTVTATVSDDIAVANVQFLVDGVAIGSDSTYPFSTPWNIVASGPGTRTLAVRAFDAAGNTTLSPPITVTVAPENVPPAVAMTSPAEGTTVAGTIMLTADATDNIKVERVELLVDGAVITADYVSPYSTAWSTGSRPNGAHVLQARARDTVGNVTLSAPIHITVANIDTTPPATAILSPAHNATVAGVVTVSTATSDHNGVASLELLRGGVVIATATAPPWSFSWDTRTVANRSHTLQTRARDIYGNTGTSATIWAMVDNGIGTAAFAPGLQAPWCAVGYDGCDTGALVDGRAGLGPEANAPNTIHDSCVDGTGGAYHASTSIDRLRIFTADGTPLGGGKAVVAEATLWTASGQGEPDVIDFYYTTSPSSPSWLYLGSVTPGAPLGPRVVSLAFTLQPSGTQMAIRATMRRSSVGGNKPAICSSGQYNDRDDLVFTVGG